MSEEFNRNREKLNNLFEKNIIEKLQYEWEKRLWTVRKRVPALAGLKPPVITITDMKSTLGQWDVNRQEICMSRNLIQTGRWDSICEVFMHEVAHQLTSSFPRARGETPHGPQFRHCCHLIGANPKASGNFQTLEERIWGNENDESNNVMAKVKKLMNLAESENTFEAERAAAKAGELITKYNIDIIKHDRDRGFESAIITEPALKISQSQSITASILSQFYFVSPIWLRAYMPEKKKAGKVLEISGTPTNIRIAEYVFHYLLQYAESNWYKYKNQHPECRSKSGFMTGVVSGFHEKLKEQQDATLATEKDTSSTGKDLIVPEDKKLKAYFHTRHPEIVTRSQCYSSRSQAAYNQGKNQGKHLTISKGITSTDGNGGRLIGS